jgi:hypothetical protein
MSDIRTALQSFNVHEQCRLNVDRLAQEDISVNLCLLTDRGKIGRLVHLWHDVEEPLAVKITVAQAAASPRLNGAESRTKVARLRLFQEQLTDSLPLELFILTYALPRGRQLIVDGNYRTLAAYKLGCAIKLTTLCIKGPVNASYLPYLGHYQPGGMPKELLLPAIPSQASLAPTGFNINPSQTPPNPWGFLLSLKHHIWYHC